jgi:transcriptional regulator with XRE-family HTH domain
MNPDPVDVHVGSRIRLRRKTLSLSQQKLGQAIGLTFQQIQKYERGANRAGASRLYRLSQVLDVPVAYFFDDMPIQIAAGGPAPQAQAAQFPDDPLVRPEILDLVSAFHRIPDRTVRRRLSALVKAVANCEAPRT